MLVLCIREQKILTAQMKSQLETFKETGGFSENMTAERIEVRKNKAAATGAPVCRLCGKPMLKRLQKRGQMQGREFWGFSDYPQCKGSRNIN